MLNIDNVRRVVKAQSGLTAPTLPSFKPFNNPEGFDQMMYNNVANFSTKVDWKPSYYNQGSEIPMPKASSIDTTIDFTPEIPQLYSSKGLPEAPTIRDFNTPDDYPDNMKSVAEFNVSTKNFLSNLKGNKFTYNPEFQRKTMFDKNIFQKMAGGIKNFAKNNPNLVNTGINMGLDYIGNQFDEGVYNSKGTNAILGVSKTLGNLHPILKVADVALRGTNKLLGKQSDSYHVDKQLQSQMGGGYTGSFNFMNEAESDLNKFYGFLSTGSRQNANNRGRQAFTIGEKIGNIRDTNMDRQAMSGNDLNYLRWKTQTDGGWDFANTSLYTKQGGTLNTKIELLKSRKFNQVINVDTKQVEEFKEGGRLEVSEWEPVIELFEEWEPKIILEVEQFQKGGKTRTLEELIEYAKKENPRFIQRLSEDPRGISFVDEEGKNAQGSHLLGYELDEEGNAIVFPSIQEMEDGNLKYLSLWDAFDRAIEKKNFLKMTPEEAKLFTESGEDEKGNLFGYKKGWPEFFQKFKKGGKAKEELETPEIEETNQKNLIPEGALHKNKHHMEHTEGLTQKGIPVIDNDGEQQAEIELDEIIFTLEVTKKLEELYKDGSDEAAIEAGKLLVKEILFNTDDRTGLISKCEKGGKLCQ